MSSTALRPTPMGSEAVTINFEEKSLKSNINNKSKVANMHYIKENGSYCENFNNTSYPNFEKWKDNFQVLLEDEEGMRTFYEFLGTDQISVIFDCWYSCKTYRKRLPNKAAAKEVYSRFVRIKDSRVPISDQARNNLALRLRANDITETLLLEIEQEIFANLRDVCYPKFLKSDFFTFYCETNGQVAHIPSEFHRLNQGVISKMQHNLPTLTEDYADIYHTQASESGEDFHHHCNDYVPEMPTFQSRTQRMDSMKQLAPEQFAKLLTEKLERLLLDREAENFTDPQLLNQNVLSSHGLPIQRSYKPALSDVDSQSWVMPPASVRYSVAGASSTSGSCVNIEQYPKYRNLAKDFLNAVHHGIRNHLGECQCISCQDCSRNSHHYIQESYFDSQELIKNEIFSKSNFDQSQLFNKLEYNTHNAFIQPAEPPPLVDTSKIYAWMEKNERQEKQNNYVAPSPIVRHKKLQNVPEAPIAQDHNMPLLPQPDTGTVLTEVKRVLEEPKSTRRSLRSHQQRPSNHVGDHMSAYSDPSYDQRHRHVGNAWSSFSDTNSVVSYNPSQISSVPSCASRLWNQYGYYEPKNELLYRGRHLSEQDGMKRNENSVNHRDRHSDRDLKSTRRSDVHSDVSHPLSETRSERTHGSGNSKRTSKNSTTITYYFDTEPIPYRITIPSSEVTLGQFKAETKRGNFRYFFKTISAEDGEIVNEELRSDDEYLPRYKNKIIGKIEKVE
ncbi:uncharacterized protein LOC100206389 isoform X1 [Hydra vulgaris]|uniref:Axin-1 n=1 Tax=Hydra vulgaris TaxID=6087 RepID=T2MJE6_HYDVU|nr:uncharacterized protein LOC100206389 isoform X1 [Hydra vulgaris]